MLFFLPLGTTRPHWRTPWVTYGLIILNGLVMVYAAWRPEVQLPGFVPSQPSVLAWLASVFVHGGLGHLAGNMLFLWLFGTVAEDTLGPALFLGFFFTGALGATLLDWGVTALFSPASLDVPRLGASGAIAGIMGLSAICFLRTRVRVAYAYGWLLYWRTGVANVRAPVFVGVWVGLQALQGTLGTLHAARAGTAAGGVAYWAHLGGFAAGVLLALALGLRKKVSRDDLVTGRARAEEPSGLFSEAEELRKVVQETPQDAEAWYALGQSQEVQGRTQPAAEAYQRALTGFVRQREAVRAADTYTALSNYLKPDALPADLLFDLACALDDAARLEEAYDLFLLAAKVHPGTRTGETALLRAGEIARRFLHDPEKAGAALWRLLADYPLSDWRARALKSLRALGLPESAPWVSRPSGDGEDQAPGMKRLQ